MVFRRSTASVAAAWLLGACGVDPSSQNGPLAVDVTTVATKPFAEEVVTISTLEAVDAVQLAAQAGGRIQELRIRQGERVKPGQLLVVLDQAQLQAELMSQRAARSKNELNYRRFEFLARVGAASTIQRDELRQAFIESSAALKATEADLAFRDLRSPIGGVIGDVRVNPGDVIKAGDPFTTVIRNGDLMARIELPARVRNRLRPGLPVLLEDPGTTRPLARGVVDSVDPSVKAGSQVLLVKAGFNNRDGTLRNGLRVRTRVVLDRRDLLSVPVGAVSQSSGQSYVFQLGTLAQLERVPGQAPLAQLSKLPPGTRFALQTRVELGPLQDGRYPVLRGLAPGTPVITSNLLSLRHGLPVRLAAPSGTAAAER
ncbi:MAG: efflux RND transporter periplasmic adaptor subunit [Cyanobacteriota bacterium]|jgi:RND family efflux transporter MFP subunit|nr:efflux RND transporter periplasmic adaptor subunit [Cyanobacteriota bacterium]